jgi:hypothetical protein
VVLSRFMRKIVLLLLLTALVGCSGRDGRPDVGPQDGLDGIDGIDGNGGDRSQSPLRIGSGQTFEIATWNIRNFPSDSRTAQRVAALIAEMDTDYPPTTESSPPTSTARGSTRKPDTSTARA